jgi:uncharacterized protein
MIRIWLAGIIFSIGALIGPTVPAQTRAGPTEPLSITVSGGQTHVFQVELAKTFEEKAQGLMYRESLAPDGGMLFVYTKELRQAMWMKNTLIPLDMLFIRRNGRIAHIHERAVPGSLHTISSRGRVLAILELRGGTAARLGIKSGDRVLHSAFDQ